MHFTQCPFILTSAMFKQILSCTFTHCIYFWGFHFWKDKDKCLKCPKRFSYKIASINIQILQMSLSSTAWQSLLLRCVSLRMTQCSSRVPSSVWHHLLFWLCPSTLWHNHLLLHLLLVTPQRFLTQPSSPLHAASRVAPGNLFAALFSTFKPSCGPSPPDVWASLPPWLRYLYLLILLISNSHHWVHRVRKSSTPSWWPSTTSSWWWWAWRCPWPGTVYGSATPSILILLTHNRCMPISTAATTAYIMRVHVTCLPLMTSWATSPA